MVSSLIKIAIRTFIRRRAYTVLNLVGLAIGLASALLVVLILGHELTYDDFHPRASRTYRFAGVRSYGLFPTLPVQYSEFLRKGELHEVEDVVRFRRWPARFIKTAQKKVFNEKVLITDPGSSFFRVFGFELVHGTADDVLARPGSIVLSKSLAETLYSRADVIGEVLEYDTMSLTVTGVMDDLPSNSHLAAHAIITNASAVEKASGTFTYAVIREGSDVEALVAQLLKLTPDRPNQDRLSEIKAQKLGDIHFGSSATYELKPTGSLLYLLLFSSIGVVVLLIAISNYVNLSVAMYVERSREIAVRMVMGVKPSHLTAQVLIETLLVSLLSLPLSLALVDVALPMVNSMLQVNLGTTVFSSLPMMLLLLVITVMVGLLAGLFPSLLVPRFRIVSLFKNTMANTSGLVLRKRMVSVQFALLALLGGAAVVIDGQLDFVKDMPLGFHQSQVIKITNASSLDSGKYAQLKELLLQHPAVSHVSHGIAPGDEDYGFPFKSAGSDQIREDLVVTSSDFELIPTLGLTIQEAPQDWSELRRSVVLVNETLAKQLNLDLEKGQKIILNPGATFERERVIDGVFSDIHLRSLHQAIGPHMLVLRRDGSQVSQNVLVRFEGDVTAQLFSHMQEALNRVAPDTPMQIEMLSDDIQHAYANENNLGDLIRCLVVIAFVTSFIGLFGFIAYLVEMRTKEIGIRVILGASSLEIIGLLGRVFLTVIMVACLAGSLGAYFLSEYWLQNFAYRMDLDFLPFAVVVVSVLFMAMAIVTWKGHRASAKNPVEALRYE